MENEKQEAKKQPQKQEQPPKQVDRDKDNSSALRSFTRYSGIGFQMVIVILIFYWAGSKLDTRMGTEKPVYTAVLTIFGVFAGLYVALKDFIFRKDD